MAGNEGKSVSVLGVGSGLREAVKRDPRLGKRREGLLSSALRRTVVECPAAVGLNARDNMKRLIGTGLLR